MSFEIMAAKGAVLEAAFTILADGAPRTAEQILVEGQHAGLFERDQNQKNLYAALSHYVERMAVRGRKAAIVQDPDRRFRINRPVDAWPALDTTGLPPLGIPSATSQRAAEAIAVLQNAARGTDSVALECAVCAIFELLGFSATHVGGYHAPDGYADALLGPLAYRVMLECKLSRDDNIAHTSAVAEAAKYRDTYHAEFCALIGLSFYDEMTFVSELHAHAVSAWSVDDLIRAATLRLDSWQMRDLFAPGFAADPLDDFAWDMLHGSAKRLRVVASLLVEVGVQQQRMAHTMDGAVPNLTRDVALSLLDARLAAAGSTRGVTREEIDAAFAWLTSPYVGRAVWLDAERTAVVIRQIN